MALDPSGIRPGPQRPDKYPQVGRNYQIYGEVPGYDYYYWEDRYHPNKKAAATSVGQGPKGLLSSLAPVAAGAIALGAGQEIGKNGIITSAKDAVKGIKDLGVGAYEGGRGLLGLDSSSGLPEVTATPAQASVAATPTDVGTAIQAPQAATQVPNMTPSGGTGMLGVGSAGSPQLQTSATPSGVTPGAVPNRSVMSPTAGQSVGYTDGSVVNADGNVVPPSSETPGFNYGGALQTVGGGVQAIQGIGQLQKGDYLNGAVNTATGAANASLGLNSLGVTGVGSETAASAMPYLGPISAGLGAYNAAKITGNAPAGASRNNSAALSAGLGSAALLGPWALAAAAAAYLGSAAFGSHKNKQQMIRDGTRKYLQKAGILDNEYKGTLADGSTYDFGKDRHEMAKLDYKDPTTGKLIALSNVITAGEGMSGKTQEAVSELYANAALSNTKGDLAKGIENVRHFATQRGFNLENVQAQLDKLKEEKKINDNQYTVFSNDAKELFGPALNAPRRNWQPGDPVSQQTMDKLRAQQAAAARRKGAGLLNSGV